MESMNCLEEELKELRDTYNSGITKQESWRRSQLEALLSLLVEKEDDILNALQQDLGKHRAEAYRDEVGTLVKSLDSALKYLKQWMSSKKAELPIVVYPSTAKLVPEPLGLVLVISTWNFPFGLSLEPLIGAVAAGNVVVLKPSELTPTCSSVLASTIHSYLDTKAVKVIEGDLLVGQQLLQQKWDKIFFTGSTRVAQIVMSAAAKHLTPLTLELGGKCPAIVDSFTNSITKEIAIKRILAGKYGTCAGQACIGVDYILVEKKFASTLVEHFKISIQSMFGDNPAESGSVARIVNKKHFSRLKDMLSDPLVKASIVHGGSFDEDKLYIEPTILIDPPLDSTIMTEEIFGPILPIITLQKTEDGIGIINSKPKPLTIYAFTTNDELKRKLISETSSGSLMFNDTIIHYAAETVPFGGVGGSGFGRYHGKFSFDTFSHEKPVLDRCFLDFWFRYPPWNNQKLQLFRYAYRYDYLGVVLTLLGLKKTEEPSSSSVKMKFM